VQIVRCLSLLLVVLISAPPAWSETVFPKVLYMFVEKRTLIAANARLSRFDELDLVANERILEQATGKSVSIVATTDRFIAYSASLGRWKIERRRAQERVQTVEAEDFTGVVVTNDRFLNFNGETGIWAEYRR
jgi:hypothetical protein